MRLHKAIAIFILAAATRFLFACASPVEAAEMDKLGASADWQRLVRIDGFDSGHDLFACDTTMRFATNGQRVAYTDESTLEAYDLDSVVIMSFTQIACVCMTMDDDVTGMGVAGNDTTGCGQLNDPNATAPDSPKAPCKLVPPNILRAVRLNKSVYPDYGRAITAASKPGYRDEQCSGGTTPGYPCDNDATDCIGGGACPNTVNPSNKVFLAYTCAAVGEGWIEQAK